MFCAFHNQWLEGFKDVAHCRAVTSLAVNIANFSGSSDLYLMTSPSGIEAKDYHAAVDRLGGLLNEIGPTIVACSGGVDSLLLATICHRNEQTDAIISHAVSPAVPAAATRRVKEYARAEGWRLELIESGEFEDPVYRANPVDRCYYCKTHLYTALARIARLTVSAGTDGYTIVSGANMDDLSEYRPGLKAAEEFRVRHPFVEAGMTKQDIRVMSRALGLASADLPASPCLASRLYTGTPVTKRRLSAVEHGEEFLKRETGTQIVRCRIRDDAMHIEVPNEERNKIVPALVGRLQEELQRINPAIREVYLDPRPYQPGRAFVLSQ